MIRESLFSADRAHTAFLGWWVRETADRAAVRVAYRGADEAASRELVRAYAALHAARAKMPLSLAEPVADREFDDALSKHVGMIEVAHQAMIAKAAAHLAQNRRDIAGAAQAVADVARDAKVPPSLIDSAMRIALWQQRKKA